MTLCLTLLEAIVNPTFGQIVGGHFHLNFVASQNADAVFAHLACCGDSGLDAPDGLVFQGLMQG